MATATIEAPEQLVAQPRKVVTYYSRRQALRLVMKPRRPERSPTTGEVIGETLGYSLQFETFIDQVRLEQLKSAGVDEREAQAAARYGRWECPTEGPVTLEYGQVFEDASIVYQWLEKHKMNGDSLEGFWRIDPTVPPVTQDEMKRLMEAATMHDTETLTAILEQEMAGWGREDIVSAARDAIDRIEKITAELRAELAAEAAAAEAKPKKGA
jgi:hypothetical protein